MSRNLVVTGGSGLVGAELVAALLPAFDRTLVLTGRQADPAGLRARIAAVLAVTGGDGTLLDRLDTHPLDGFGADALARLGYGTVAQVWNIGATLSYDPAKLRSTVAANTAVPLRLLAACRPEERFFQVSTVGVTGPGGPTGRTGPGGEGGDGRPSVVLEEPVWDVDAVNPYVVSKVLTEHMLDNLRHRHGHRVTSLRIGSVLGPARHPVVQANRAGYFTLVEMVAKARLRGVPLTLDVSGDVAPPLAHVDQIAASCAALAEQARGGDGRGGDGLGAYYHLGDQRLTNAAAVAAVNEALGAEVLALGPARTALDRAFASVNADNLAFMECGFVFDHRQLDARVPESARPAVDAASFAGFVTGQLEFLARRREEVRAA
ncbi:NAD(P)-dependent oxidoreductase [Streptomyces sp. NPDC006743]|uniref:NAD-dependent epimerase/dehydratase family protein n=1 Tax=Streptomyces sp. NPDC006743 TaxID=3154480 RepID=UPI003456D537